MAGDRITDMPDAGVLGDLSSDAVVPIVYPDSSSGRNYRFRLKEAFDLVEGRISASVGSTYAEAQSTTIDASVDVIRLTDRGMGVYERVTSEPAHEGKFRSADRFLPDGTSSPSNGGWWALIKDQDITPVMFGATKWAPPTSFNMDTGAGRNQVAMGCPDSVTALNNFWAAMFNDYGYFRCDVSGVYGASSRVFIGGNGLTGHQMIIHIKGDMTICGLAAMEKLIVMGFVRGCTWSGSLNAVGIGSLTWSTRTIAYGIVMEDYCAYAHFDIFHASGFACGGVVANGALTGMHFIEIGMIYGYDNASGVCEGNAAYNSAMTAAYSGKVNSGAAYSTGQRTTYTVSADIPTYLDQYSEVGARPVYAVVDGRLYHVADINRTAHTVGLYPWVHSTAPATGTIYFVFGGMYWESGGDAGQIHIGSLVPSVCGIGYHAASLYPAQIDVLTNQSHGVGVIYRAPGFSSIGGKIGYLYSETGQFDLAVFNTENNTSEISLADPINLAKVTVPYRWNADPATDIANPGLYKFKLSRANGERFEARRISGNSNLVYFGGAQTSPFMFHGDTTTVYVNPLNIDGTRLGGDNRAELIVTGTGTNSEPTGTVTLTPPSGKTLNGGAVDASVTYTNNKAPLHLIIEADSVTGNVTARRMRPVAGTAITAPTGGATIDAEARAAINSIRTALQAFGVTL